MTDAFAPDSPLVARVLPSPNFGERRGHARPDCVVLHYTGMPTAEARSRCSATLPPKCRPIISSSEDGEIAQLVPEDKRAWHAGIGQWGGVRDLNSASIGIEIVNPGHDGGLPPFPQAQIDATIALVRDIAARRAIRRERVLAHSDVAPARKRDPGERFPVGRAGARRRRPLGRAGADRRRAAVRPGQEGPPVRALQAMLALYGYGIALTGVYDAPTRAVVAAFQRHFRPARVDGEADASTMATLRALIDGLARG